MKIRHGFVSNSSATAFIVFWKPGIHGGHEHDPDVTATEEDYKKLIEYGFRETCESLPERVHRFWDEWTRECDRYTCDKCPYKNASRRSVIRETEFVDACMGDVLGINLCYAIGCNEDEPIKFLIDNNIPFIASLPYEEGLAVYRRGQDNILVLENDGNKFLHNCHIHRSYAGMGGKGYGNIKKKEYPTRRYVLKEDGVFL